MLFTVILVLLALRSDALPFLRPGEEPSRIHAVLMAGVPGGIHDAMNNAMNVNVARMYHQLLDRGVPAANIIVFLNDDITNNPELNPFPGHLYTGPERKKDWREGVLVDYTSFDINVENYIAVLTSNAENLNLTKGGSGRVLKSGPHDRVFILHSSHGADGLICVNLHGMTKKQLHDTFDQMISKKLFSELTFYLSACQSGSMFADDMERFPTIYGLTGALPNQFEIMFGYTAQVDGRNITTGKYGEFFNALYNELLNSAATELLSEQFEEVRSKVKASTVTQYGNLSITKQPIGDFEGPQQPPSTSEPTAFRSVENTDGKIKRPYPFSLYEDRLAEIDPNSNEAQELKEKIKYFEDKQKEVREIAIKVLGKITTQEHLHSLLDLPSPQITNNDCHHKVATSIFDHCSEVMNTPFIGELLRPLIHLCERGDSAQKLVSAVKLECH